MDFSNDNPMMLSKFNQPKRSLAKQQKELKIIKMLIQYIQDNYEGKMTLLKSVEFLNVICNLVEDLVKKHEGIDKKKIVVETYKGTFGETVPDVDFIDQTITYLLENKKIKKTKMIKKIAYHVSQWFFKKVL